MQIVIDGYNLLFQMGIQALTLEQARKRIMEFLEAIAQKSHLTLLCVFDGKREKGLGFSRVYFGCMEVIYTADGISADEHIIDELKRAKHPGNFLVVTSDKQLAQEAKHCRSRILETSEFLQKYAKISSGTEEKPTEDSVWSLERYQKSFEARLKQSKENKL